jgi:hypothetical protein
MKRASIGVFLVLALIASASLYSSRAQEADGAKPTVNWAAGNPLKIALLKWYQANVVPTYFNVGKTQNSNPYGVGKSWSL